MKNKGYVYVASVNPLYYELSLLSATSLKQCYDEANITLFTHDKFVDERAEQIFDQIITNIPVHRRSKMWCMARTPYDQTFYNDVDSSIVHPDISKVFDMLSESDIFMCRNKIDTVRDPDLAWVDLDRTIELPFHGAVCWYNKTELTIDLLDTWYSEYNNQIFNPWPYEEWSTPKWKYYDMFTLWKLVGGKFEEFNRFTDLIQAGPRRFNSTIVDGAMNKKDYGGAPVNYQIPRNIYSEMYEFQSAKKRLKNATSFSIKHYTSKDSIEFN